MPPPNMPDTGNAKIASKIAAHKFFYFYSKKRDLTNIFD